MKEADITIINTGVANIASITACLERFNISYEFAEDGASVENARAVILPGVGSFESGMNRLIAAGQVEPLKKRILAGKPTLAICLGLQLLFARSEESPGVEGLGIIYSEIKRFKPGVRVPHFGWNKVDDSYAYFANSYRATEAPEGWDVSWSDYGGPFVAMMKKGSVMACQFHPELSGEFGSGLISSWIKEALC